MSTVHEWDRSSQQFTSQQYIATRGAKAVQSVFVQSFNFIVFANSFDSVSQTSEIKFVSRSYCYLQMFLVCSFL